MKRKKEEMQSIPAPSIVQGAGDAAVLAALAAHRAPLNVAVLIKIIWKLKRWLAAARAKKKKKGRRSGPAAAPRKTKEPTV